MSKQWSYEIIYKKGQEEHLFVQRFKNILSSVCSKLSQFSQLFFSHNATYPLCVFTPPILY